MYQCVQGGESSLDLGVTNLELLTIGYQCLNITWVGVLEGRGGLGGGLLLSAKRPHTGLPQRVSTQDPSSGA